MYDDSITDRRLPQNNDGHQLQRSTNEPSCAGTAFCSQVSNYHVKESLDPCGMLKVASNWMFF